VCSFLKNSETFQIARAASAPLKMEARLRAQCNSDLAEDVPSKLEQILKDRYNPDLSADKEAVRRTALLDGIADAEVRLDRLEAAKCQPCQRNQAFAQNQTSMWVYAQVRKVRDARRRSDVCVNRITLVSVKSG
jgi:hypothetical protein